MPGVAGLFRWAPIIPATIVPCPFGRSVAESAGLGVNVEPVVKSAQRSLANLFAKSGCVPCIPESITPTTIVFLPTVMSHVFGKEILGTAH